MKQLQAGTNKELRIVHLNVCSLRSKIEERRCLQLLCRFEILAVTETHLDKSVPDSAVIRYPSNEVYKTRQKRT